ncbi:hypothetical protein L3V64_003310 [Geobacillus stearothermophilus]|jgi:hypothetical protein|uniref:hypothetical protein n=1 Tax=Geobacillus stearothermophilus TaxID=1422 RepID=UPI001F32C137|nr:hypothetical protein [Geobacillus stearothermophilus]MCK7605402.1 hypothetical protein [Geobacillus stearothermophilus]
MEINPGTASLLATAANIAQNNAQIIFDKIKAARASKNKDETINRLEEIINDLIHEKNQLIQILQVYEEQLITQKMSEDDINYITDKIVPLLEQFLDSIEGEETIKARQALEILKPLLSKETFNILQLLGFNFKRAIGEPLTQLLNAIITSKIPVTAEKQMEYQMLVEQRNIEYFKILQDEEASQRLLKLTEKTVKMIDSL